MKNGSDIQKRIVASAKDQFFNHGFTRVTLDEIASEVGISKKTIYKYFPSKEDLVRGVTDSTLADTESGLKNIIEDPSLDFVGKLREIMKFVGLHLSKLSLPLIEDLRRNTPELWEKISEYRTKRIYESFGSLIREGRQKGIFREDIDENLVILMYADVVEHLINPQVLSDLPFTASQLYETVIKVIFEGIMTADAKTRLSSKKKMKIA